MGKALGFRTARSTVAPPSVHDSGWARNPIDRFVLARLETEKLKPSPEADRATLIRRLSLDLTGLPPTPDEVDAFAANTSPRAYEELVDRLLASPHYGERMAMDWLDGARYADTNGYQNDFARTMWPWRDWVIAAFNRNEPFDQFVTDQMAGDLLPGATLEQRIATGFNRNNRTVTEAGSIDEEWRIENAVDRVETTATVFLGLTMGCARCHDHKFDPISQTGVLPVPRLLQQRQRERCLHRDARQRAAACCRCQPRTNRKSLRGWTGLIAVDQDADGQEGNARSSRRQKEEYSEGDSHA